MCNGNCCHKQVSTESTEAAAAISNVGCQCGKGNSCCKLRKQEQLLKQSIYDSILQSITKENINQPETANTVVANTTIIMKTCCEILYNFTSSQENVIKLVQEIVNSLDKQESSDEFSKNLIKKLQ